MTDSDSLLSQKLKIMDSSVSFDLNLSFSDVMNDLSCSKEQIARRFKLLVEQKQVNLRKQITNINTANLKILQEKTNYFDEVNKTNKQLKQQILKKILLNQTLSSQINSLQQEIQQLNKSLQNQQQRFKKFEQHTLEDYKRLETVERKYKQLLADIEEQKNNKNELQRKVDTMKNQKVNWGDRIAYLIQNRQKGLMEEYKQEINNLKDILLFYEQDNKSLKQQLLKEKQSFAESKEGYEYLLKTLQQKYGLQSVSTYRNFRTQTQQNTIKRIDVATQVAVECHECRKINDIVRHFIKKSVSVQTMKDPHEQIMVAEKFKDIFTNVQRQKQIYEQKLNYLEEILSNQPSKTEDLKTIARLNGKIVQKQRTIQMMKNEHLTLKSLNTILHSELQHLKIQLKDGNEVRIQSLQFKKKSTSVRLFTEEMEENVNNGNESKVVSPGRQIKPHTVNQKRFTRTVDLGSTMKSFGNYSKNRMTPESSMRDNTSRVNNNNENLTFRTSNNAQSNRWQRFEQKLKNPELFSQSPFVNAVRREKYKKFSSLKKRRNQQSEKTINFTVAF